MLKDLDDYKWIEIIAGRKGSDTYSALSFAFWAVVIIFAVAIAAGLAVVFKCI